MQPGKPGKPGKPPPTHNIFLDVGQACSNLLLCKRLSCYLCPLDFVLLLCVPCWRIIDKCMPQRNKVQALGACGPSCHAGQLPTLSESTARRPNRCHIASTGQCVLLEDLLTLPMAVILHEGNQPSIRGAQNSTMTFHGLPQLRLSSSTTKGDDRCSRTTELIGPKMRSTTETGRL